MPYSPVIVIGYNANPPEDDGSQVTTNEISWAKHIEKIGGPLKTAIESIDSNVEDIITEIEADIAVLQANLTAPSGTVMLFGSAAPSGWTTQNTYTDHGLRLVGTAGTPGAVSGDISWSSGLADRTIAKENLPSYNLGFSLSADAHTHYFSDTGTTTADTHNHTWSDSVSVSPNYYYANLGNSSSQSNSAWFVISNTDAGTGAARVAGWDSTFRSDRITVSVSGSTSSDNHSHSVFIGGNTGVASATGVSGTISSDGSDTAMNFNIQTYDVILATKD